MPMITRFMMPVSSSIRMLVCCVDDDGDDDDDDYITVVIFLCRVYASGRSPIQRVLPRLF
jgi:hypothetical protein